MQTLTTRIVDAGLAERLITDAQIKRLVDGTDQRRYHLVHRAIEAGEFVRIRRGLYSLANRFRRTRCHPFAIAQMIVPGSYVSFHSALAHHGWIPEAVLTTTSVTPGRKTMTERHEQFGQFTFRPLALAQYRFLDLVQRVDDQGQNFLVASPLRAFMDLVCLMKVDWPGMEWAEDNLRIEPDRWKDVTTTQLSTLRGIYKQHRVHQFIKRLEDALGGEPSP